MRPGTDLQDRKGVKIIIEKRIMLAHGGGGSLMNELITSLILPRFSDAELHRMGDAATLHGPAELAVTTDSHVIKPIFFSGGDIGRLAVAGTVNDLLAGGALPIALTMGLIIEEGLLISDLERILDSMKHTSEEAGIRLIAGDTKVVEKGSADGIFTCSTGIGIKKIRVGPEYIQAGDAIIVTGLLGEHGAAVMMARNELPFDTPIISDVSPLNRMIAKLWQCCGISLHHSTDPTRGGLAAALSASASAADKRLEIFENRLPVSPAVRACCDILGLEFLELANEGKMLCFVASEKAEEALNTLRSCPYGRQAAIIGQVKECTASGPRAVLNTVAGGRRIIEMPYGENLPRIC